MITKLGVNPAQKYAKLGMCLDCNAWGKCIQLHSLTFAGFMKKKVAHEWNNRYEELFVEGVIPYIGRVFVLPKDTGNLRLEDCTGTVGLVGGKGESIGAFHSVRNAWKFPDKFDVYIKYANHDKQPSFPAKIEIYSEELDLFIAMPLPPFQLDFPRYLCPASGVSVGDLVHCLGFPKMIDIQTLSKLGNHAPHAKRTPSPTIKEQLEYPAVFSGKVCFSGWKQVVADYRSFPNSTGAVIVDDNGHLKGIHISTLSATGFNSELCSLDDDEDAVKKTQMLFKKVNSSFPQIVADAQCAAEAAVFVPINILMKSFTAVMDPQTKHSLYI